MNRHAKHLEPILAAHARTLDAHGFGRVSNKVAAGQAVMHPMMLAAFDLADEGTPESLRRGHEAFARVLLLMRDAARHFDGMAPGADPLVTNFVAFVDGVLPEPAHDRSGGA